VALSEADKAALLGEIGFHWDSAYSLDHDGEVFTAARIGYPEHILTAETTAELRQAIRSDYFAWMAGLRERMST
jgi:hypothetical protein